jgi:nitrogen fixation NifU-like protein
MYPPELLDHFRNPRNVGELAEPACTVEVSNPACGDTLRLSVRWAGDRICDVSYKTRGCPASIAAGSALTEWLAGRTRAEAAKLPASVIDDALGGLPAESKHAATLCIDAVRAILRI